MADDKTAIVGITLRVREDLRASLEEAAKKRRVSLTQEIIDRLEYVRDRQDLLSEVLQLKYGQREAGLLLALGLVMGYAGRLAQPPAGRNLLRMFIDWTDETVPFDNAIHAATSLLEAARPDGSAKGRLSEKDPGVWIVDELLSAMGEKPDVLSERFRSVFGEELETIKKLLGPIAERMVENRLKRQLAKNPNRLLLAILEVVRELHKFEGNDGELSLDREAEIIELLEQHLGDFLLPDWQQRGRTRVPPGKLRIKDGT